MSKNKNRKQTKYEKNNVKLYEVKYDDEKEEEEYFVKFDLCHNSHRFNRFPYCLST